jgi:hypothetical protein
MASNTLIPLIVVLVITTHVVGCSKPEEDEDLLPPSTTHTVRPLLDPRGAHARFGSGWFPAEVNADGAWRWMGESGEIKVTPQASATPSHVRLEGWVSSELASPTTIEIRVDQKLLDSFVASPNTRVIKEYDVPTPVGGEMVFTIHASVTAHPKEDSRSLGFSLVSFSWTQ